MATVKVSFKKRESRHDCKNVQRKLILLTLQNESQHIAVSAFSGEHVSALAFLLKGEAFNFQTLSFHYCFFLCHPVLIF